MVVSTRLLRIFWPSDIPTTPEQGVVIGWRNGDLDFLVVSVLRNVEARRVQGALHVGSLFKGSSHPMKDMYELCGATSMHVIGTLNPPSHETSFDPDHLLLGTAPRSGLPMVSCSLSSHLSVQIILFDRPSSYRMEYMSLAPIPLVLGDKPVANTSRSFGGAAVASNDQEGSAAKARLVEKLKLHTVVRRQLSQKERLLSRILTQINCSAELASLINSNLYHLRGRQKRSLSVGEKVVQSAATLRKHALDFVWHLATTWLWPFLVRLLIFLLVFQRVAAEIVLLVLEWRPRSDSRALKDFSATAQQLDIRLQQFCYWPIQNMTLRKRKRSWESVTDKHPDYIRFYSSLWLVANDIIIGMAVGSYIIDNADWVAHQITLVLNDWTVEGLMNMIRWLREYPAGLKLNNELAVFLGGLVLLMIEYFKTWFVALQPWLPSVIHYIGIASFAGTTMPIAIFSDLLSLATYHILCFYTAFARIFHWQLTIILSLFHLFRGKKKNVLRKRIDSCDYDLDQLLLGTILFTLLFFLLPTVVVFYLTFTSARMGIIFINAALDMLLALLNHFPIFALMLRIKDSRRLPGGISFELRDTHELSVQRSSDSSSHPKTSYIILKSVPLSLRELFDQYFQLAHRIRKHYFSLRVVLKLVTGDAIPPIPRKSLYSLQYSMLPAKRAGMLEVWQRWIEGPTYQSPVKGKHNPSGEARTANGWVHGHKARRSR